MPRKTTMPTKPKTEFKATFHPGTAPCFGRIAGRNPSEDCSNHRCTLFGALLN